MPIGTKYTKSTKGMKDLGRNMKLSNLENKLVKIIDSRFEEIRRVDNPVRNHETYMRYSRGCNLIKDFVSSNNRGYAHMDSPDSVGRFHSVTIFVTNEDFESQEEIKQLCEILECFDSMTLSFNDDKILITLLIENVYVDGRSKLPL